MKHTQQSEEADQSEEMDHDTERQTVPQKKPGSTLVAVSRSRTLSANWSGCLSPDDRHHVLNELTAIQFGSQILSQLPEVANSQSASFALAEIEKAIKRLTATHHFPESGSI